MTKSEFFAGTLVFITVVSSTLYLSYKPISATELNEIITNRNLFMVNLGLNQAKLNCYKEPSWVTESCQTVTNTGFPVQFSCNRSHCEFIK